MKEMATVISIENKEAKLAPIPSEVCLSCSGGCDKKESIIEANIPSDLTITPGMTVYIKCNRKEQGKQGVVSLLIPFMFAITGYFIAPLFTNLFSKNCNDGIRATFVLGLLLLSTTTVFFINKKRNLKKHLNIVGVVD